MHRSQRQPMELKMNPAVIGFTTGAIHHVMIQYPNQAGLCTTMYAYAFANALFGAFLLSQMDVVSLGQILENFITFTTTYQLTALVLKTLYNVYFRHRGVPGKFWFVASDWTFWNHSQTGKPYEVIAKLHQDLGNIPCDVVRIQPNHIVFNNINALEDIYGHSTKARKSGFAASIIASAKYPLPIALETFFTRISTSDSRNKSRHAFLRRVMSSSFSPISLKRLEATTDGYYNIFLERIGERASQNEGVIDMNEWFHKLSFDIGGALALGQDFSSLQADEAHFFIKSIHRAMVVMNLFSPIPWLSDILKFAPMLPRVMETRAKLENFTRTLVTKCLERDKSKEELNILGSLRRARDPETGESLSFGALVTNSNTMLIAAADTTAVSLTFVLFYTISILRVWSRLSQEVRSSFEKDEDIDGRSTAKLPFLNAVIHESLRMRPAASGNPPRITPPEGMTVAGHFIHGNTVVSCSLWAMLHDERFFSHPDSFIPERWIESECGDESCVKDAWIPFGYGQWSCIGKPLAMMVIRVTIAKLIWNYDIGLNSSEPLYDHKSLSAGKLDVSLKLFERE